MDKEIEKQGIVDYWTWRRVKSLVDDYKNSDIPLATLMRGDYSEFLPSVGRNLVSELEYSLDTPGAMGVGAIKKYGPKRTPEMMKALMPEHIQKKLTKIKSGYNDLSDLTATEHAEYKRILKREIQADQRQYNSEGVKKALEKTKAKDPDAFNKKAAKRLEKWKQDNPEQAKALQVKTSKKYRENHPEKIQADTAYARAKKSERTPSWLTDNDLKDIQELYEIRQALQEMTGKEFHVDHMVPLRGKTVSGLHVPNNLRVIPGSENIGKYNKWNSMTDIEALGKAEYERYRYQKDIVDMFKKGGTE